MALTKVDKSVSSTPGIVDNSDATAITIDSSEQVGIGTTSMTQKIAVNGKIQLLGTGTDNDSYSLLFNNGACAIARDANDLELHAYNAIVFGVSNTSYPSSTERMRIDSSGTLFIGGTAHYSGGSNADDATLAVNGSIIRTGVQVTDFDEAYVSSSRGILEGTSTYQASNNPSTEISGAGNFFHLTAKTTATSGSASNNYILQVAYGLTGLQYTRYSSNNGSTWSDWIQRTT